MPRSLPWIRILAEGTVIVVSILLGLGLDAWWDDVTATRDARSELRGVLAELEDARDEIERGLNSHEDRLRTALVLRARLQAADTGEFVTVPDTLLSSLVFTVWVTDAPSALVESFVQDGHLAQLQNDQLREEMLRWGPGLEDLRGDELRLRALSDRELTPYVAEIADVSVALETITEQLRRRRPVRRYPGGLETSASTPLDHESSLPATLKLRNLLTQKVDQLGLLRTQSGEALTRLDALAEVIRRELR